MASEQLAQLKSLCEKIQNLSISDVHAKALEGLVKESIVTISGLQTKDYVTETRRKAALRSLESELPRYLEGYWSSQDPLHRISQLSKAREEAHHLVATLLTTLRR
jgi:hydrogenase maturation factor HypF (carbamoyltransferase family)